MNTVISFTGNLAKVVNRTAFSAAKAGTARKIKIVVGLNVRRKPFVMLLVQR